ncbi:MAG: TIGR00645 family protein [Proteobacteria bacterium]|nr:TIGR00645 family protein [Pseudomonadota bacterium]NDE49187.1 TIGR00645 family protein [Pseudomonadota bacterium]NKA00937.1 TIGR00645 family protein [Candidatus Fonsibacter sp. PEL5]
MKRIESLLEKTIFASRWILAPFYLGLSLSLLVLLYEFIHEIIDFIKIVNSTDIAGVLLFILSLVDISLAGNLLIIVIFSGYENFVSKIDVKNHEDKPDWMGHVDFTDLKIKLISSIVAISGIHLLKVFMNLNNYDKEKIIMYVVVHLSFVVSGVLLALMDYIMSKSIRKHKK